MCGLSCANSLFLAMIVVVQGTNRQDNATRVFTNWMVEHIKASGEEVELIDLQLLPSSVLDPSMYSSKSSDPFIVDAETKLKASKRWVMVFPEYNGSFPGVLKLFIDAVSVRDYKGIFKGSAAALIGTATGRSGNLRGLDHFSSVLSHTGAFVMPQALPISQINKLMDEQGRLTDAATERQLADYLTRFRAFADANQPVMQPR